MLDATVVEVLLATLLAVGLVEMLNTHVPTIV